MSTVPPQSEVSPLTEPDRSNDLRPTSRPVAALEPIELSGLTHPALRPSPLPTLESPSSNKSLHELLAQVIEAVQENNRAVERYRQDMTDPTGSLAKGFERMSTAFDNKIAELSEKGRKSHEHTMIGLSRVSSRVVRLSEQTQRILLEQGVESSNTIPAEQPYNVLVVDDEPGMPEACARNLTKSGVVVHCANSTATAMLCMMEHDIDVVLCDIVMPGNGSTLARHLKDEHPEVVVVLMSAHNVGASAGEAIDQGAFGFLAKPFPRELLQLTIERAAQFARSRR